MTLRAIVAVLALVATRVGGAQDAGRVANIHVTPPGKVAILRLADGTQLVGTVVRVDSTTLDFRSSLGQSTIPLASVREVREDVLEAVRGGQYSFPDPNATRMLFAPTGRMLKAGEGYFSDYWVFLPGVAVGLTDNITLGGGVSIVPGLAVDEQLYYLTPKVGVFRSERASFAVGALVFHVFRAGGTAGILYGVGTWGKPDASFTVGLGYGFVEGKLADRPAVMLGGARRISPRLAFVTENYLIPGLDGALISGGLRFLGRDLSVDLALMSSLGGDSFVAPFLGFVWKF
jgi:hypothetical protein